uniref:Uncharacterized protein AlNc14C187G8344 n=1 Tax=Albugo laibachii Nc14 TaxID=890382 RepID=F0WPJ9_9STRA|nr:conserved hypothetical protein [Albugo laibachii Nc14]|eukprot:CCA23249.1 conserved hypothetical protein [Albugo laibachii Nc14]
MIDSADDGASLLRRLSEFSQRFLERNGDDHLIKVDDMYLEELRETEKMSREKNSNETETKTGAGFADRGQTLVTIDQLDGLFLEFVEIDSLGAPSIQRRYRDALLSVIITTFAGEVLRSHESSGCDQIYSKIHEWLLNTKAGSFSQIIEIICGLLKSLASESQTEVLRFVQESCFKTLFEILQMMTSSINTQKVSISSLGIDKVDLQILIENAVECLALLVLGPRGEFHHHWISRLDSESVFFLLEWNENTRAMEATNCENAHLNRLREREELLIRILVASVYCEASGSHQSDYANSLRNRESIWLTRLDTIVIKHREILLRTFYSSESLIARSMIWILFSDSAFATYCSSAPTDSAESVLQDAYKRYEVTVSIIMAGALPEHLSAFPVMLLHHPQSCKSPYATYIWNQADPETLQSETVFMSYFSILCKKLQIFEYFDRSKRLQTIQDSSSQNSQYSEANANDRIMREVESCLQSNNLCDVFRGERLLAELLMYDHSNTTKLHQSDPIHASLVDLRESHDELEDTFCFDSEAELVVAARSKFWQLGRSKIVSDRLRFCRVLQLYLKRKFFSLDDESILARIQDLDVCISALICAEKVITMVDVNILLTIFHAFLEVSTMQISPAIKDRQDEISSKQSRKNASFLVTQILSKANRLRIEIVVKTPCILFASVMHSLQTKYHPVEDSCRESCCGHRTYIIGDYAALCALILEQQSSLNDHAYDSVGGKQIIAPMVQHCCDTRIVLCVANYL